MSSLPVARGFMCTWEMRRGMPCCSSQWSCRVSTTACPPRSPWCSGSTSHTVATAPEIPSASPTAWAEDWEQAGWLVEPEESVEGTRQGWRRATSTAQTAAAQSELWHPSLVPQSRCQSTTRTETSPSSTVRLKTILSLFLFRSHSSCVARRTLFFLCYGLNFS